MSFVPVPSQDDYLTACRIFLLSVMPAGLEIVAGQDNDVPEPKGPDFITITPIGRDRISLNETTYADCSFIGSIAGTTLTVTGIALGAIVPGATLMGYSASPNTLIQAQLTESMGGTGTYQLNQTYASPIPSTAFAAGSEIIKQKMQITLQLDVHGPNAADNVQTITTLFRDDYATLWFFRQGYSAQGMTPLYANDPKQMAFVNAEQNYEDRWSLDVVLQVDQVITPPMQFADVVTVTPTPVEILPALL